MKSKRNKLFIKKLKQKYKETKKIKQKLCAKYKNSLLALEDEFSQLEKKIKERKELIK
mgnify:CR=1 FL=1